MTKRPPARPLVPVVVAVAAVGVAAGAALLARGRKEDLGQHVKDLLVAQVLEGPARRTSYAALAQALERGGTFLAGRAARALDTESNRETLAHIIGIERWGHNRLRVALGERSFERDDYHGYRPPADASLSELRELLSQTRARSVDLARRLHQAAPADDRTIVHNDLGPLSPKAWIRYLIQHADIESRRLKAVKQTAS